MRVPGCVAGTFVVCAAALVIASTPPALAQFNQFEIKEPKVEKGEFEIEYSGDYSFGPPRRRFSQESPGEFVFDANEFARQRHTLGIGYGFTKWLSLQFAIEAEEERFDDPETLAQATKFDNLKVTEIQIEGTVVLIPSQKQGFGAAFLFEHNIAIERSEGDQLFLGTALQYAWGPWSATANLYAVKHFGGQEEFDDRFTRDERWDFQYAAQIKYQANEKLAVALESYGVVERLGSSGTKPEERELFGDVDRFLLGPVFYYSWGGDNGRHNGKQKKGLRVRTADANGKNGNGDRNGDDDKNGDNDGPSYTVGAGVLFGLNENTADVVLKWNLGVEF